VGFSTSIDPCVPQALTEGFHPCYELLKICFSETSINRFVIKKKSSGNRSGSTIGERLLQIESSDASGGYMEIPPQEFKILVADDSPVYRKLLERALSQEQCSVVFAKSGSEAIN